MNARAIRVATAFIALLVGAGCTRTSTPLDAPTGIVPSGYGTAVDRDLQRARRATTPFRTVEGAAAAGYARGVVQCMDNPPAGAMGFHHRKESLMDAELDVERPEILVYGKTARGDYTLNGVEYIVPFSAWPKEEPPKILGQALTPAPALGLWYLHVWLWEPNPSGLFADWNPAVSC